MPCPDLVPCAKGADVVPITQSQSDNHQGLLRVRTAGPLCCESLLGTGLHNRCQNREGLGMERQKEERRERQRDARRCQE